MNLQFQYKHGGECRNFYIIEYHDNLNIIWKLMLSVVQLKLKENLNKHMGYHFMPWSALFFVSLEILWK